MNPPPPALAHVNEPLSTCANRTASFLAWSVARNSHSYQLSGYIIRAGIISFAFHSAHFPEGKGNEFPSRTRVVVSAMSDRKYVICHAGLAAWQLHPLANTTTSPSLGFKNHAYPMFLLRQGYRQERYKELR